MTRPPPLRRAHAFLAHAVGGALVGENYALGRPVPLGAAAALVGALDGWTSTRTVEARLRAAGDPSPRATVLRLLSAGVLVERSSRRDREDVALAGAWPWGPIAGGFWHLGRDAPWASVEGSLAWAAAKARRRPPPTLPSARPRAAVPLPAPRTRSGVLRHLLRRRSVRTFSDAPLSRAALADVLFAGLGVREVVHHPDLGDHPLRLAPSGGARQPVEGLVSVRRVRGLAPGLYRYDGLARALAPVRLGPQAAGGALLGGQAWVDGAAAIVFLEATWARTAWKYAHPAHLRAVLLEAGHVAQNLLVAACDLGLAAVPTCAFSAVLAEAAAGVEGPERGLVHAVVLGTPATARAGPAAPSAPRPAGSPRPRAAR
ncbi:MAG: SagB/ThcOx family dehydrogenase [Anaeromyxobacteraceae bacterium]